MVNTTPTTKTTVRPLNTNASPEKLISLVPGDAQEMMRFVWLPIRILAEQRHAIGRDAA
jgi:hypothetical protein